jgi:serine/threonine protein phosphatase PrpC
METDVTSSCCWLFEHLATKFESEKQRHPQAAWELPTAAFALAQITDEELQIAWAADCYILHMSNASCTWCTEDPQTRNEAAEANALGVGIGAQKVRSEATIQNRRQKRCQKNYRALSPDIEMSHRSTNYSSCSIQNGDDLLIMSDGFASLVGDYGAYDKKSLAAAVQKKGLAELAKELRDIEQDDAECLKFPRFKLGDDATALWVRIAG